MPSGARESNVMSSNQLIVLAALFVVVVVLGAVVSRAGRRKPNHASSLTADSPFAELMSKGRKAEVDAPFAPATAPLSQRSPIQTEWEPDNASPVHAPEADIAAPGGADSPFAGQSAPPPPARLGQVTRAVTTQASTTDLEPKIRQELDANRKISAIKLLRDASGCGLAQAKNIIEAYAAGDREALRALIGETQATAASTPVVTAHADVNPGQLHAQIATLLGQGRKVAAVKLMREYSGWNLARSKEAVDALEAGNPALVMAVEAQSPQAAVAIPTPTVSSAASPIDEPLLQQLRQLIAARRKIEAIKLLRDRTGWGLKQSKEYVESLPNS